ncbi:MAG: hypothetical protein LKI24_04500 [Acidipropionibacterium sp.]|jgi:hypothetical protein|nr:hypothetical protein [Acidipropionibacterium sp.]
MGLFSRRRPDPDLQALDAGSAEKVRGLVRRSFEALGIEARVEGGHVDSSLGSLSLEPVARECADQDRRSWPFIVDEVVKRMVRSLVDGASQLSDATILEHAVVRLLPDAERMGRSFRYARPLAGVAGPVDGVVVALAWDGEESLDLLNDAALSDVHDMDAVFAAGRENLVADFRAAPVQTSDVGVGAGGVGVDGAVPCVVEVSSPSWLAASWALLPGEVAARFLPSTLAASSVSASQDTGGVLLAAPDHQHLLVGPATEEARAEMSRRVGESPVLSPTVFGV